MKRNYLIIGLLVLAIVAVFIGREQDQMKDPNTFPAAGANLENIPAKPEPKKNHYAPPFKLASLEGTDTYEVGGKRDKVMIVNFWAAWCGPCEVEAPDLKDIYEKHKDKLDLYAVNATNYDKLREAKDFVKEQGFVFPVLTDAKGEVGDAYKVFSYPINFIIDRDGVIRERIEGVISREEWEALLKAYL